MKSIKKLQWCNHCKENSMVRKIYIDRLGNKSIIEHCINHYGNMDNHLESRRKSILVGSITIQKDRVINNGNGLVLLEDGTKTTLKRIRTFLKNCLYTQYNPKLKRWAKIDNLKWLKGVK